MDNISLFLILQISSVSCLSLGKAFLLSLRTRSARKSVFSYGTGGRFSGGERMGQAFSGYTSLDIWPPLPAEWFSRVPQLGLMALQGSMYNILNFYPNVDEDHSILGSMAPQSRLLTSDKTQSLCSNQVPSQKPVMGMSRSNPGRTLQVCPSFSKPPHASHHLNQSNLPPAY
jgi:hypothetical protein